MNLRRKLQQYITLNSYVEKVQSIGFPGEYTRLDYITFATNTYLDTNVKFASEKGKIEIKAYYVGGSNRQGMFGAQNGPNNNSALLIYSNTLYVGTDSPVSNLFISDSINTLVVEANNGSYSVAKSNGTIETGSFDGSIQSSKSWFIGGMNGSSKSANFIGDIYSVKIWDNDILVFDGIPAKRNSDNVIGMYDTVSGNFLVNSTGTLTAGPSTTDFKDAIHNGLKEITAYGKASQPAKDYLDTVTANGGTELVPVDYIDSAMARGKTQLRRVPIDYEELEYVTFDGTQIVDTGIYISQDDEIQSKFYGTANTCWVYGTGPDNPRITCYLASTGNQRWGNVAKDNTGITRNVMNTVIQNKTAFTLNGTSYPFPAGSDFTTTLTLTLGNCNTSTGTPYFSGNFYYMKIYQNSKLALNLVPAKRKFDNTIGFYNTVSNSFIVPSTGTLIAGPSIDIPSDYTRLAYLTGDGNAYIDLGISLTQEDEFELDFIMPSSSVSMQNIFGYRNSASSNAITAMIASTSNSFVSDFNNSDYSPYRILTSISASTEYKVITNKNSRVLYQGDTLVDSNTTVCGDTITTGNALLFNIGGSPAYQNKFTGSISKAIIKNRISLIPVKRNSDGVLGMYDIINNQFYTNAAGIGAFIAGPEINSTNPNNPCDIYCNNGKLIKTANEANYVASNVTLGYWIKNADGQPEVSAANFYTNMMPVKPDTSYVAYGRNKSDSTLSQWNRISWYDSTGTWISNCTYTQNVITVATSPSNAAFARFHCNTNGNTITQEIIDGYNWTFCEGTQEVDYVPFITTSTQEVLQDSRGNIATVKNLLLLDSTHQDTQEIVSGIVNQKTMTIILTGAEEWGAMSNDRGYYTMRSDLAGVIYDENTKGISSHFPYTYWYPQSTDNLMPINRFTFNRSQDGTCNGNISFRPDTTIIDTVDKWKAWLTAQYFAGTPVVVVYPLNTAINTTVDSQALKTEPVYIAQGGLDNLTVDVVSSTKTVPAPNYPLDIRCNNGVFKSLLPSDYIELDYVESVGNSIVDTLKVPNANTKFVLDAQVTDRVTGSGSAIMFGNTESGWATQSTIRMEPDIFRLRAYASTSDTDTITSDTLRHTFVVDIKNGYSIIDNTTLATWTPGFGTAISTLKLFAGYWNNSYQFFSKMKVYFAQIYENDVLVMNLVPAKKKSVDKIGFYDTISGNFFSNIYTSGSELSAGNIIPKVIGTTETLVDFNGTTNLFDKDTNPYINAYVHATTGKLTQGTEQYCFCIPCKPRTTYFLFGMSNPSAWGSFTSNAINTTATTFVKGNNVLTTGPNDQYLIGLAYAGTTYDYRDTLNIVEYTDIMNTATCEDLYKVGTYADTQEILTGLVTHNVGVLVLDGVTTGRKIGTAWNATYKRGSFAVSDMKSTASGVSDAISTHFEYAPAVYGAPTVSGFCTNNGSVFICFLGLDNVTSADTANDWLAAQYAAGNPVIIIYPLATATTESVSTQTLITPPVSIKQASMSGLTVDTTQTNVTVPTPTRPLDIVCNNGKLGPITFDGGYKQLEYLESSGTQYINLGIKGNGNTKIEVEWMWYVESDVSTSGRVIGGRYTDSPYDAWAIGTNTGKTTVTSSNTIFLQYYGSASVDPSLVKNTIVVPIGNWTHIVRSKDECIINGTDYGSSTANTFETPYNLHLFAFAQSTSSSSTPTIGCGIGRCKYLKIWNGDTLVLDLVPVVSSNGTLGMYNKVNGDFLTNGGSGNFTAGPTIIDATGTPETITIHSKNLFNKNGNLLHGTYNATNGSWVDNENFRTLDYIPGKPGVSYTISAQSTSSTGGNAFSVQAWDSTHTNWLGTVASSTAQSTQYASGISPAGTAYLSVSFAPNYRDINTLQLEEDYRPTIYEEYGSQTLNIKDLLSVSNFTDSQSIVDGIVSRKIGVKVFDGTENWQNISDYYNISKTDIGSNSTVLPAASINIICTHYETISGVPNRTSVNIGGSYVNFRDDNISTLANWTQYLANQYAAGTPVIILYPLATTTTETVDAQYCGLTAGNSNAEITGSIDGLTAEVYYKKLK